jgi:hypothetical protein
MLWITIFSLSTLAACVFLKNLMIYIALICSWAALIFHPAAADIPDYIKMTALAVCIFGIRGIMKLKRSDDI